MRTRDFTSQTMQYVCYKTIDLVTKYNNFTWECIQLACVWNRVSFNLDQPGLQFVPCKQGLNDREIDSILYLYLY